MIAEDYVTFETAKLLKEKGFNEGCLEYYAEERISDKKFINRKFTEEYMHNYENFTPNFVCVAPTLQKAMKWLRKEHNLFIEPYFTVLGFRSSVTDTNTGNTVYTQADEDNYYASPEVSCEYALIYCLENLIKDSNSI